MHEATACSEHVLFLHNYRRLLRQIPKRFRITLPKGLNNYRLFARSFLNSEHLLSYPIRGQSCIIFNSENRMNQINLPQSLGAKEKRCLDP